MFNLMAPSGVYTAQIDMTVVLAPLGIGLLSLLVVSAGMIMWGAVRSRLRAPGGESPAGAVPSREQKLAA